MRFLALWKVLVSVFPLIGGKPVSQVLQPTGVYPHAYAVKPAKYYSVDDPNILDYYDVQDPHEDTIVYDYIEETPVKSTPLKSNYEFAYGVHDDKHGTAYSRKESADSKGTKGQYQVNLPDGRIQTVIYSADEHGYRAQVLYEGEAVHDDPPRQNALPHPPVKKLKKEKEVHTIHKVKDHDDTIYRSPHNNHVPQHQHQEDALQRTFNPAHHGHGHQHNFAHGLPHVTDFPFSPVAPSSVHLGHHPFVTAPFHSSAPHPHPLINTHGPHHAIPHHIPPNIYQSAASAYPFINPIMNHHANAEHAVHDPLYRGEVGSNERFARGTDYEEDSTAIPVVETEE